MEKHIGTLGSLRYITLLPDEYNEKRPYPVIILLHGYGSSMDDLCSVAPYISSTDYIYVCPNGPIQVPIGPLVKGFAWMRISQPSPLPEDPSNEDNIMGLLAAVTAKYTVQENQIILGGFSQGAMVTYQIGLPSPDIFLGLVALSGRIQDTEEISKELPELRTQPIFIAHGSQDNIIPLEHARSSKDFLVEYGYSPTYNEYQMSHQITMSVIADLKTWIHQTLAGL